jgi:hypothetical protein
MASISRIDVEAYKKRNLLHIYQISSPIQNEEGLSKGGVEDIMNKILADSKPPVRIVSRLIPQVITEEQMEANIKNRKYISSHFSKIWRFFALSLSHQ